jgi:hypothetical protein
MNQAPELEIHSLRRSRNRCIRNLRMSPEVSVERNNQGLIDEGAGSGFETRGTTRRNYSLPISSILSPAMVPDRSIVPGGSSMTHLDPVKIGPIRHGFIRSSARITV